MTTSESIDEIATALVAVQSEIVNVTKGSQAQYGSYASLEDVLDAVRPALTSKGIAVLQSPGMNPEAALVTVTTRFVHSSGQWLEGVACSPFGDGRGGQSAAQQVGSTITYLRRYALAAMVGIGQADNDGTIRGGHDANAVHDLGIGTVPQAAAEASSQGEGAAATAPPSEPSDDAVKRGLQAVLMDEFKRLNADFDAVKASCQKLAGVDTIFELTVEQLETAIADIEKRFPAEAAS